MPVDAPEDGLGELQIMFATSDGDVRRNALDDFTNVMRNGKIAMKLPEGVRLINARICSEDDDVMLTTAARQGDPLPGARRAGVQGPRIRPGVRGIRLAAGDEVVSMAVIRHFEASAGGAGGLSQDAPRGRRRAGGGGRATRTTRRSPSVSLGQARYVEMSEAEDLLLTITENGAGKLSSRHDYPVRGRGGQGVAAMDRAMRGGAAGRRCFPVEQDDQIMLATDAGQSIRVPVEGISFRSRAAGGVRVFNTGGGERVVSVALIAENGVDEDAPEGA